MNLKQIHRLAQSMTYDDFESHMIEVMTGKTIFNSESEKEPCKPTQIAIIGAKKASIYAKSKFGMEFFDEKSMDVIDCIKDYYKGFLEGFNHQSTIINQ